MAFPAPARAPVPAPIQRRALSRQEAADVAMHEAVRRGYRPRSVRGVERDEAGWDVRVKLAAPPPGDLRVGVDPYSGAVVRFDVELRGRRHEHDRDDDEHEHGERHARGGHRDDDED
ncbi:MAG TPA: hypothetical protein VIR81_01150 [Myxococcales bacterium]